MKVIQIATCQIENTMSTQTYMITTALCDDGSIWERRLGDGFWYEIPFPTRIEGDCGQPVTRKGEP